MNKFNYFMGLLLIGTMLGCQQAALSVDTTAADPVVLAATSVVDPGLRISGVTVGYQYSVMLLQQASDIPLGSVPLPVAVGGATATTSSTLFPLFVAKNGATAPWEATGKFLLTVLETDSSGLILTKYADAVSFKDGYAALNWRDLKVTPGTVSAVAAAYSPTEGWLVSNDPAKLSSGSSLEISRDAPEISTTVDVSASAAGSTAESVYSSAFGTAQSVEFAASEEAASNSALTISPSYYSHFSDQAAVSASSFAAIGATTISLGVFTAALVIPEVSKDFLAEAVTQAGFQLFPDGYIPQSANIPWYQDWNKLFNLMSIVITTGIGMAVEIQAINAAKVLAEQRAWVATGLPQGMQEDAGSWMAYMKQIPHANNDGGSITFSWKWTEDGGAFDDWYEQHMFNYQFDVAHRADPYTIAATTRGVGADEAFYDLGIDPHLVGGFDQNGQWVTGSVIVQERGGVHVNLSNNPADDAASYTYTYAYSDDAMYSAASRSSASSASSAAPVGRPRADSMVTHAGDQVAAQARGEQLAAQARAASNVGARRVAVPVAPSNAGATTKPRVMFVNLPDQVPVPLNDFLSSTPTTHISPYTTVPPNSVNSFTTGANGFATRLGFTAAGSFTGYTAPSTTMASGTVFTRASTNYYATTATGTIEMNNVWFGPQVPGTYDGTYALGGNFADSVPDFSRVPVGYKVVFNGNYFEPVDPSAVYVGPPVELSSSANSFLGSSAVDQTNPFLSGVEYSISSTFSSSGASSSPYTSYYASEYSTVPSSVPSSESDFVNGEIFTHRNGRWLRENTGAYYNLNSERMSPLVPDLRTAPNNVQLIYNRDYNGFEPYAEIPMSGAGTRQPLAAGSKVPSVTHVGNGTTTRVSYAIQNGDTFSYIGAGRWRPDTFDIPLTQGGYFDAFSHVPNTRSTMPSAVPSGYRVQFDGVSIVPYAGSSATAPSGGSGAAVAHNGAVTLGGREFTIGGGDVFEYAGSQGSKHLWKFEGAGDTSDLFEIKSEYLGGDMMSFAEMPFGYKIAFDGTKFQPTGSIAYSYATVEAPSSTSSTLVSVQASAGPRETGIVIAHGKTFVSRSNKWYEVGTERQMTLVGNTRPVADGTLAIYNQKHQMFEQYHPVQQAFGGSKTRPGYAAASNRQPAATISNGTAGTSYRLEQGDQFSYMGGGRWRPDTFDVPQSMGGYIDNFSNIPPIQRNLIPETIPHGFRIEFDGSRIVPATAPSTVPSTVPPAHQIPGTNYYNAGRFLSGKGYAVSKNDTFAYAGRVDDMHVFQVLNPERNAALYSGVVQLRTEHFAPDVLSVDNMPLGYGVIFDGAHFHPTGSVGSVIPGSAVAGSGGAVGRTVYGAYDPAVESYVIMTGGERFRYAGTNQFIRLNRDETVAGTGVPTRIVIDVYGDQNVAAQWLNADGWNVGDLAYFDGSDILRVVNGSVVANPNPVQAPSVAPSVPASSGQAATTRAVYYDGPDGKVGHLGAGEGVTYAGNDNWVLDRGTTVKNVRHSDNISLGSYTVGTGDRLVFNSNQTVTIFHVYQGSQAPSVPVNVAGSNGSISQAAIPPESAHPSQALLHDPNTKLSQLPKLQEGQRWEWFDNSGSSGGKWTIQWETGADIGGGSPPPSAAVPVVNQGQVYLPNIADDPVMPTTHPRFNEFVYTNEAWDPADGDYFVWLTNQRTLDGHTVYAGYNNMVTYPAPTGTALPTVPPNNGRMYTWAGNIDGTQRWVQVQTPGFLPPPGYRFVLWRTAPNNHQQVRWWLWPIN